MYKHWFYLMCTHRPWTVRRHWLVRQKVYWILITDCTFEFSYTECNSRVKPKAPPWGRHKTLKFKGTERVTGKKEMEEGVCVCVYGCVLKARRRKASLIHQPKAIYVRITLPEQVRQERCCTSNYLIREATTLCVCVSVCVGGGHWLGEAMGSAVVPGHSHYCCN